MKYEIKVGDLVRKIEGLDWGIVTQITESGQLFEQTVFSVYFMKMGCELPIRREYVELIQKR